MKGFLPTHTRNRDQAHWLGEALPAHLSASVTCAGAELIEPPAGRKNALFPGAYVHGVHQASRRDGRRQSSARRLPAFLCCATSCTPPAPGDDAELLLPLAMFRRYSELPA